MPALVPDIEVGKETDHGIAVDAMATTNHNSDLWDRGTCHCRHHGTQSLQTVRADFCLKHTNAVIFESDSIVTQLFYVSHTFMYENEKTPPKNTYKLTLHNNQCVHTWKVFGEGIPAPGPAFALVWALCSGGRGGECLSGHTTGQNGCL